MGPLLPFLLGIVRGECQQYVQTKGSRAAQSSQSLSSCSSSQASTVMAFSRSRDSGTHTRIAWMPHISKEKGAGRVHLPGHL